MTEKENDVLVRESEVFVNGVGRTATAQGHAPYTVTGSYMDSNGCMKTHGTTGKGRDESSFIQDTNYSLGNL